MNVRDYIAQKFSSFGIQLSEADLLDISLGVSLEIEGDVTKDKLSLIEIGMAKFIPSLLLRPISINESGFSMSWDKKGVQDYYSFVCRKYKMRNELEPPKPKAKFL